MKTFLVICILIGNFLLWSNSYGQSRKDLEEKKKKTEEDIEYTSNLLNETQKSKKNNVNELKILEKRIQLRSEIIENIEDEIHIIEEEEEEKKELINEMGNDINKIRKEYEKLIMFAYKTREQYSSLMFILAANDFNSAYKRLRYLKQLTELRRKQALMIKEMQDDMGEEIIKMEVIKTEKQKLINEKTSENNGLKKEMSDKNRIVQQLGRKEQELRNKLKEKQRIAERLKEEIEAIIAEEAKKAKSRDIYRELTPEEKIISDNFTDNKGRLPWPTERGIITEKFGKHPHPVLPGVTIENNGIDITTVEGAVARALFDGEVSKVIAILGANYTVIIRHGNFLTVYQNLINVKVKKGDKVKVKQQIGTIYTEKESNTTILHIEIWKELSKQNPEEWLSKK